MTKKKDRLAPKHCKNCDGVFKPVREWQEFCDKYGKGACKKQFWRAGGVSVGRLRPIIAEMIAAELAPLLKRLQAIEEGIRHR
jgi:hypothetical protein